MTAASARQTRVIGGGAAGFFAAITCAETNPACDVEIFEAAANPLQKVRISGGGRCNVTAGCFEPAELTAAYPRGGKELRGPFTRFQPRDVMAWFEARGVALKIEPDGRVFPQSDQSATVVECLLASAKQTGVRLRANVRVRTIAPQADGGYRVGFGDGQSEACDCVLIATGSAAPGYAMAAACGHTIEPCVPSLFSFRIRDQRLTGLAGISMSDAALTLKVDDRVVARERGAVLITHEGLSGPAVIRLSSWAARVLHTADYKAQLEVNWLGDSKRGRVEEILRGRREEAGRKELSTDVQFGLPKRLWARIVVVAEVPEGMTWANLNREMIDRLSTELTAASVTVAGRGRFKEEFVTCGGVRLKEVDFRTMQSRIRPGLFFAGEVLDIDGITGGYNLQSAWTTGWIAGRSMAEADTVSRT